MHETQINADDDRISHSRHYTYGNIESIDYIESCGFGYAFELGNVLKYVVRADHKGRRLEDLKRPVGILTGQYS